VEQKSPAPPPPPTVYDLIRIAPGSDLTRLAVRCLFTPDYEKSIWLHETFGTQVVRKVIMRTIGRVWWWGKKAGTNYHTDPSIPRIEADTNYSVIGSAITELLHATLAIQCTYTAATKILVSGDWTTGKICLSGAALNSALIAVQRYNRARMMQRIDGELRNGAEYSPDYQNWAGIDARALGAFRARQERRAPGGQAL
jgi:hypothetical protein